MPSAQSIEVARRGRGTLAAPICALIWLAAGPVSAQDERRVPAPRAEPGLLLRVEAGPDHGPALEPIGAGRLRHKDPRFTAIIEADGSVEFRDVVIKADANLLGVDLFKRKLEPPRPVARDSFEERAMFPHGPPTAPMMVGIGGAGLGGLLGALVSKLRRKAGGPGRDNARANLAAKAAFLAETEALRMRMAHAWLKARLAEQQGALVDQVLAIWRDTSLTMAARRRRIFTLWDECEDPGESSTAVDEIRAEAAREARARVEALIRRLAPAGSPEQFTAAELAEFNAGRRSRARFDPYGHGEP